MLARERLGKELDAFGVLLRDIFKKIAPKLQMAKQAEPGYSQNVAPFQKVMMEVYSRLADVQLQGIWYRACLESGIYSQVKKLLPDVEEISLRYAARVGDCLPTGQQVLDEDIDPLVNWSFPEEKIHPRAHAVWRQTEKRLEFRRFLDEPEAIAFFKQHPDLTWSAAFSLIKSAIEYRTHDEHSSVGDRLFLLHNQRKEFSKKTIVSRQTKLVRFHGVDAHDPRMFSPETFNTLSSILGLSRERDKVFDAHTDQSADTAFVTELEKESPSLTVFVDTHGREKKWGGAEGRVMRAEDIARSFGKQIESVFLAQGSSAVERMFEKTTIIGAPCYARDFLFEYFMPELKKYLARSASTAAISLDTLLPPQIISLGQSGDPIFERFNAHVAERFERWKRTNEITGEDFLEMEPYMYGVGGDMSISSQKPGEYYQISIRSSSSKFTVTA